MLSVCPDEIIEGQSSFRIIDNDGFMNDTLTGGGTSHGCKWTSLQHVEPLVPKYEASIQAKHVCIRGAKAVTSTS